MNQLPRELEMPGLTPGTRPEGKEERNDDPPSAFHRLTSAAQPTHYRHGFYTLALVLTTLFLAVILHGPCLQVVYGHDAIVFLNGAWKVRCGIWPNAGYASALGALNPWLYAAGMFVLGPTAAVLPICNVTVAVGLGLLAWTVARCRLPALPALFFALTQTLVAAAAHLLRYDYFAATYDGYYNRQGYALASILLLLLFLPREQEEDGERGQGADGRLAGAILGVMLFSKISYFMAGVGLCAVAALSQRPFSQVRWGNTLAAFGIVFIACLPLIGFDLPGMLRDLRMAAGARRGDPASDLTFPRFFEGLTFLWVEIGLLATAHLALPASGGGRRAPTGESPGWAAFAGLVGLCLFIHLTNAPGGEKSENPLLASWLFVVLGRGLPAGKKAAREKPAMLCGLLGVLWIFTFGTSLQSLCWSNWPWPTQWQAAAMDHTQRFDAQPLSGLPVAGYGGGVPMPLTYTGKVNDGLRLLRALGGTHRVETLDYANPFPFALQWPAAHGGFWCWQNGYTFSAASHPAAAEAFGDADVLMVPRYPDAPESFRVMTRLYGDYLKAHFHLRDTSEQWYVLTRL